MSGESLSITATETGVAFDVKVVPGASRDRIAGLLGDALKIQVTAPPQGGKANAAVCELLAQTLGVSKRDVSVIAGHSRPRKRIAVAGVGVEELRRRLETTR